MLLAGGGLVAETLIVAITADADAEFVFVAAIDSVVAIVVPVCRIVCVYWC